MQAFAYKDYAIAMESITISDQDLKNLINIAQNASSAIMNIYDLDKTFVEYKSDNSPITDADRASHKIITKGLKNFFPNIPIVSEEGDFEENKKTIRLPSFWLVDPLDGTQDFVNRTGDFCVAIGLIENNHPSFGIVSAPTYNAVYYGGKSYGSFKISDSQTPQKIQSKALNKHIIGVSRTHTNKGTDDFIKEKYPSATLKKIGSMLKQVMLASGEIDIYPVIDQPLHLWDTAAGQAIIEGAGGLITKLNGQPLDYSKSDLKIGDFIATAKV